MNSLENMKKRLEYSGGVNQQKRMIEDKLKSLKKSLLNSYQAETLILDDGRNFRCLINPSKLKDEYDNKTLSVPFEDICLGVTNIENEEKKDIIKKPDGKTTESFEKIPLKQGSVFEWKENGSYWLVHLQHLEEIAYFRAEIKKCNKEVQINKNKYKVYVRGSSVTKIDWTSRRNAFSWNDLNYDLLMLITNNEETNDFCHRFGLIYIDDLPYQIEAVDNISTDGIIQVALKEYYKNTIEDKEKERVEKEKEEKPDLPKKIVGADVVDAYETVSYFIEGFEGDALESGKWEVNNPKVQILEQNCNNVKLKINTGRSGSFTLSYLVYNEVRVTLNIKIESL